MRTARVASAADMRSQVARCSKLSMPEQQLVEIAKALDADARIVIMDEPTASLGRTDAKNLFGVI